MDETNTHVHIMLDRKHSLDDCLMHRMNMIARAGTSVFPCLYLQLYPAIYMCVFASFLFVFNKLSEASEKASLARIRISILNDSFITPVDTMILVYNADNTRNTEYKGSVLEDVQVVSFRAAMMNIPVRLTD